MAEHSHAFPWRLTAILAAVVIAATAVAGLMLSRERVGANGALPAPTASASGRPLEQQRQLTVLLVVRDAQRRAVSNVLLGFGGQTEQVAELILPRALLLPTQPPIRLEDASDPTGRTAAEQPLSALLGVQIDATVDLDRLAWHGLIDTAAGRVDPQAARSPGSFPLVIDRVLSGVSGSATDVGQLLTSLGSMARTTVPNEDTSYLLSLIGRRVRGQQIVREVLPVTYVRAGADRAAVIDQPEATKVISDLFPLAQLKAGHSGLLRAEVVDAGANLGVRTWARSALGEAGFAAIDSGAMPSQSASEVLVADYSEPAQAAAKAAVSALGLPISAIRVSPGAAVDVRVVLGADLRLP